MSVKRCGVGIIFRADVTGALAVFSVAPGSPAAADIQIKCGDLLTAVRQPLCSAVGVASGSTAACEATHSC
jgi:C-terminal processing protease CtpA/Prc